MNATMIDKKFRLDLLDQFRLTAMQRLDVLYDYKMRFNLLNGSENFEKLRGACLEMQRDLGSMEECLISMIETIGPLDDDLPDDGVEDEID